MLEPFKALFDKFLSRPSQQLLYAPIPTDHILDESFASLGFIPEESYFELRLAEMHLQHRGELFRNYVPLCVVVVDYHYEGESQNLPVIVSNQRLRELAKAAGDADFIELLNSHIVGPVPLTADGLGLFVGMFRSTSKDFAEALFDFMADVGGFVKGMPLAELAPLARLAYGSVVRLLGQTPVQYLFGTRDELRVRAKAGRPLASGYFVFSNAPNDPQTAKRLWVRDARLWMGSSKTDLRPFTGHDYCLIALEHHATRGTYSDLPFHKLWESTRESIWTAQVDRAEQLELPKLGQAIRSSPDLVPGEQTIVLGLYRMKFEAEIEAWQKFSVQPTAASAKRGKGKKRLSGRARLRKAAADSKVPLVSSTLEQLADAYGALQNLSDRTAEGKPITSDEGSRKRFDTQVVALHARLKDTVSPPEQLLEAILQSSFPSNGN